MSRRKLIASLAAVSCCVVAVITGAAVTFPLKAAPRPTQSAPRNGVSGGISGDGPAGGGPAAGPSGGISGGITGGVSAGVSSRHQTSEPEIDYSTIWTAAVKRSPMLLQVRGLGTLARTDNSSNFIARVALPQEMMKLVQPNQNASVDTRKGIVKGRVTSISAEIANGMGSVDIALATSPQVDFTAGHQIDSTIDIETLDDVLQVGRPASIPANCTTPVSGSVFRIVNDGKEAERVVVKFGRCSVSAIEVLDGLKEGDKVIISDLSNIDKAYRIHLTDQMHLLKH